MGSQTSGEAFGKCCRGWWRLGCGDGCRDREVVPLKADLGERINTLTNGLVLSGMGKGGIKEHSKVILLVLR
jgi:hypothetical protein